MPISLLLGASETRVVSSCRDVRGVVVLKALVELAPREFIAERCVVGMSTDR